MDDERSYTLPTETLAGLDLSHHLQDLIEIRSFFESQNIGTKNTRIERYCQYLEEAIRVGPGSVAAEKIFKNSAGEPFLSPADWILYVLREVHELMWILKGLKVHLPLGVDEKLSVIAGGRDFAALDIDSQSRNAQFELRIASYFCQGGCDVDMSTNTDIIASTNRDQFYLECKRVGSKAQLGKRLSEARTQLGRRLPKKDGNRRVLGCVAVDVTKVAFAHNGLTFGITKDHSRDVIRDKLLEIARSSDRLLSFDSCRKLLGYWLQIHIPTLVMMPPPPTPATRISSFQIARPRLSRKDAKALSAFYDIFESASKEDERASPPRKLTPRNIVEFPAGSTFNVDHDRILMLLEKNSLTEEDHAEVIGTLTVNGKKHDFTFFEVRMLPRDVIDEWKQEMSTDLPQGYLLLLAQLYRRRYPYKESEL